MSRGARRLQRGQSRLRLLLRQRRGHRGRLRSPAHALRARRRDLLRLQRHRRELARARVHVPVLPGRCLRRYGPRRHRRMRRPGILLQRREAAPRATPPRQAHGRRRARSHHAAQRHPLSAPQGRHAHPGDRTRHLVPAGRDCRHCAGRTRTRPEGAYGRRALRQRRRIAGPRPRRHHLAGRCGCAVLRRHEDGPAGRRGDRVLRQGDGRGIRLPLQAGRPARIQDALPVRALACDAGKRRLVAARRARQRDGATPARPHRTARRRRDAVADRGQRRVHQPAAGCDRTPAPSAGCSTPSSAGAPASCARGRRPRRRWTTSRATSRKRWRARRRRGAGSRMGTPRARDLRRRPAQTPAPALRRPSAHRSRPRCASSPCSPCRSRRGSGRGCPGRGSPASCPGGPCARAACRRAPR